MRDVDANQIFDQVGEKEREEKTWRAKKARRGDDATANRVPRQRQRVQIPSM